MLSYTEKVDIELFLQSVSRELKTGNFALFGHGNIACKLEVIKSVELLYISWDTVSFDGEVARQGLCAPIEDIESVELDEDTLTIRSVFNCTVNRKLTGSQTLIFKGTIGKMVKCKEFESLLEQEQEQIELENICLH